MSNGLVKGFPKDRILNIAGDLEDVQYGIFNVLENDNMGVSGVELTFEEMKELKSMEAKLEKFVERLRAMSATAVARSKAGEVEV